MIVLSKPDLLYRLSKDGQLLYLRVPDDDTDKDAVLTFNRVMADYGFADPKQIFNERLGVAVVNLTKTVKYEGRLLKFNMLDELRQYFTMLPITTRDWHTKRF